MEPANKILTFEKTTETLQKLKHKKKKIVLVGGIFDILHRGHIEFLENSKKEGDVLIIALESDQKAREEKGKNRPINIQDDRAFMLSRFEFVDYIIMLPYLRHDLEYRDLVKLLQPDIIAITNSDPLIRLKESYAKEVGGKVLEVISKIKDYSTTSIETKL